MLGFISYLIAMLFGFICIIVSFRFGVLTDKYKALLLQLEDQIVQNEVKSTQLVKLMHQKKSSEVRTGQIAEQMAPFLDGFPYDPKQASFLGNPIDFVIFSDDAVHFVEVKSGKSHLSTKQRKIRDLIKEGKVTFEIYRVKGE